MVQRADDLPSALAALGAPAGTTATFSGDPATLGVSDDRLAGFPSDDNDFLALSSGDVTNITDANTSGEQGTDLPPPGVEGDTSTLSLDVPISGDAQAISFEFTFLSEEFPEFVGSSFNDFFSATVNGTEVALDISGNPITVNNNFFDSNLTPTGTFFDGQTPTLRATAPIDPSQPSVDLEFSIGDVGDGIFDSAAFVNNLEFVSPEQVVFLQFDPATVSWQSFNFDGSFTLPGFAASETLQQQILEDVESIFTDYLVEFTLEQPDSGDFSTIFIGGSAADLPAQLGVSSQTLGRAETIDGGNRNLADDAFVLTGNFGNTVDPGLLTQVIAHEFGHLAGLRHVDDSNQLMFPFAGADRTEIGGPTPLAEISNGAVTPIGGIQDSNGELANNLGLRNDSVVAQGTSVLDQIQQFFSFDSTGLNSTLFDVRAAMFNASSDGFNFVELGDISPGSVIDFALPITNGDQIILVGKSQADGEFDVYSQPTANDESVNSIQASTQEAVAQDGAFDLGSFAVDIPDEDGVFGFDLVQLTDDGQISLGEFSLDKTEEAAPIVVDDSAETLVGEAVTIDVLSNDSHPTNDVLDISIEGVGPTNGTVEVNPDQTVTYTPAAGFVGQDTFDYIAQDGNGDTATASVTVEVQSATPSFPQLVDGMPLAPSQINGVASDLLTTTGLQQVSVSFVGETALFESTLGYFARNEEGAVIDLGIVFANTDGPDNGDGSLQLGDSIDLGLFAEGTEIGFFLIQNGAELGLNFNDGNFLLTDENGDPADLSGDVPPSLSFESAEGSVTNIDNPIFFTRDNQPIFPLNNSINDGGNTQFVSGINQDGVLQIGVEDLILSQSDGDFDDLIFTVSIEDVPLPLGGIDIITDRGEVFINDGTGQFVDSGQFIFGVGQGIELGDLDGDGDLDGVTFGPRPLGASNVLLNDGNGIFADTGETAPFAFDAEVVALGDADNDGDLDVFIANSDDPSESEFSNNGLFLNDGTGSFVASGSSFPPSNPIDPFPTDPVFGQFDPFPESANFSTDIEVGDLDGDGDIDAVVSNFFALDQVLINDGAGNFSEASRTGAIATQDVELGDMDSDGDLDLVFAGDVSLVMLNDGTGSFVQGSGFVSGDGFPDLRPDGALDLSVDLGDLDNDGDLDAILFSGEGNRVFFNEGDGTLKEGDAQGLEGFGATLVDLDGDSDLDAVVGDTALLNDGSGSFAEGDLDLPEGSFPVAFADLDGDIFV